MYELGVRIEEEPEWDGPDPLKQMVAKGHVVCRKPRGHDKKLLESRKDSMTDNGLAALTERLVEVEESKIKGECISDACDHDEDDPEHQPTGWVGCGDAAAILGERGVFLPDAPDGFGWALVAESDPARQLVGLYIKERDTALATIATLRAAMDGLVETAEAVLASDALDPDEFLALDRALRAALRELRGKVEGLACDCAAERARIRDAVKGMPLPVGPDFQCIELHPEIIAAVLAIIDGRPDDE